MAIETIEKLTKKIKSVLPLGCKYNADMVTNGYKLTRRVAEKLKDMDIHYIQVTLDGSKQAHDSRRILHNHQPTFEHICHWAEGGAGRVCAGRCGNERS